MYLSNTVGPFSSKNANLYLFTWIHNDLHQRYWYNQEKKIQLLTSLLGLWVSDYFWIVFNKCMILECLISFSRQTDNVKNIQLQAIFKQQLSNKEIKILPCNSLSPVFFTKTALGKVNHVSRIRLRFQRYYSPLYTPCSKTQSDLTWTHYP